MVMPGCTLPLTLFLVRRLWASCRYHPLLNRAVMRSWHTCWFVILFKWGFRLRRRSFDLLLLFIRGFCCRRSFDLLLVPLINVWLYATFFLLLMLFLFALLYTEHGSVLPPVVALPCPTGATCSHGIPAAGMSIYVLGFCLIALAYLLVCDFIYNGSLL